MHSAPWPWASGATWTDDASARLTARKFRFFSPVVFFDKETREITGVFNAALTNNPATQGQEPLVASATTTEEPPTMKLVLTALALAADAPESTALSAVEKLKEDNAAWCARSAWFCDEP